MSDMSIDIEVRSWGTFLAGNFFLSAKRTDQQLLHRRLEEIPLSTFLSRLISDRKHKCNEEESREAAELW
jgi:hypothetical protein